MKFSILTEHSKLNCSTIILFHLQLFNFVARTKTGHVIPDIVYMNVNIFLRLLWLITVVFKYEHIYAHGIFQAHHPVLKHTHARTHTHTHTHTHHASTSSLRFLQAGCPSCRPTNSVKALKAMLPVLKLKQKSKRVYEYVHIS